MIGKEFSVFPAHLKRRRSPQERREELQGHATIPRVPRCLSPCFPSTASTFKPRIDSHHGGTWDSPEENPRGRASWIFSSGGRCSQFTTGTSGTRCGGLGKGQSPCELLGSLSGFLSRRFRGLRPRVELVPEPEDSSPVLTWILGYFWSLPRESVVVSSGGMHVRLPPEL